MNKEKLILQLKEIDAIKFGSFILKSGIISPFYIDLRDIVSYPLLLDAITDMLIENVQDKEFDIITGIPYTALPIAALVAYKLNKPLIYTRKEEKVYGIGKKVIGNFKKGVKCLVIDDVITTGESKIEIAQSLEKEGIIITDFVVIVDRSANGEKFLKEKGYQLHSLITIQNIITTLTEHNLISKYKQKEVEVFIQNKQKEAKVGFLQQADFSHNPLTKKLYNLMKEKESNLILSLDIENQEDFFSILDKVGNEIVMLKTHIDIIKCFNYDFIKKLTEYSLKYDFLLFEDRKFADIGNTVRMQYRSGIYKICDWAEFVTVHLIAGASILKGLFDGISNRSSFLLASMSTKGNLINDAYTRKVIEIGKDHKEVVSGFIGFGQNEDEVRKLKRKIPSGFLLLMPGVKLEKGSDALGQTYISVKSAVRAGADCIIVGRGIYQHRDTKEMAKLYRDTAWNEYVSIQRNAY